MTDAHGDTAGASDAGKPGRTFGRRLLPVLVTLGLLALLALAVDIDDVLAQLAGLRLPWLGLAVLISVPQLALCALRWRYTAARLGAHLPYPRALSEYYLSTFFNQVLPTGIAGDALRVARHSGDGPGRTRTAVALHAVVLERASGQLVLALWALSALPLWLGGGPWLAVGVVAAGLGGALFAARSFPRLAARLPEGRLARVLGGSGHALLEGRALWVQLGLSTLVLATFVAHYYCAARALGMTLPVDVFARVTPLVLVSMALPVSFAGWGLREATNAALFAAIGLSATDGVALGICYGLLTLAGSAPALPLLALRGLGGADLAVEPHPSTTGAGGGEER